MSQKRNCLSSDFELGAITAMGLILTLGNVFGGGEFFYIGNLAVGVVLYGCAQCIVPNIYAVYSAFAYIRAQASLGHYPQEYLWDELYYKVENVNKNEKKLFPPDLIKLNYHSFLFLCLAVVNLLVLGVEAFFKKQYLTGFVAFAPSLAVVCLANLENSLHFIKFQKKNSMISGNFCWNNKTHSIIIG